MRQSGHVHLQLHSCVRVTIHQIKWWLRRPKHRRCRIFPPQLSDSATEMIDLSRRELARIAAVKAEAENKVIPYKDTVDNWSFVIQIQCLPASDI